MNIYTRLVSRIRRSSSTSKTAGQQQQQQQQEPPTTTLTIDTTQTDDNVSELDMEECAANLEELWTDASWLANELYSDDDDPAADLTMTENSSYSQSLTVAKTTTMTKSEPSVAVFNRGRIQRLQEKRMKKAAINQQASSS